MCNVHYIEQWSLVLSMLADTMGAMFDSRLQELGCDSRVAWLQRGKC
jgi:hypothetical protein